jgi:hypothetical protein
MSVSTTEQEPRALSRRRRTVIGHWLRSKAAGYAVLALFGVAIIAVGISFISRKGRQKRGDEDEPRG